MYFKTDAIRHLYFDGLQECVRRGLMTDEQADERFRSFLECARKGIGEDAYLLSCWGILSQAVGLADACRIATDANPSWGRIQMQIAEAARCFFAQRILFTIDSDHICARTELEWARMLLSFISVTGGVYMLSDPLECYDEPRLQIIKRTLPSLEVYTAETGSVNYTTPAFCWPAKKRMTPEEESNCYFENGNNSFGTLWSTFFCMGDRDWVVVLRNALIPLEEEAIALEALGLPAGCRYAVYDFWEDEFLGIVDESVKLKKLQIGHVQVCALTPVSDAAPVLIASDRHVSMDAVSVTEYKSEKGLLRLKLHGIKGESFTYCIYSEQPCSIEADCRFSVKTEGKLYRVTVAFEDEGAVVIARYVQTECS